MFYALSLIKSFLLTIKIKYYEKTVLMASRKHAVEHGGV